MTELLLASNNDHKHAEFVRLFPGVRIVRPREIGVDFDHPEDGDDLSRERARQGPGAVRDRAPARDRRRLGALRRRPRRGAGGALRALRVGRRRGSWRAAERNALLLARLAGAADRRAYFVCCLVLVIDGDRFVVVQETVHGEIAGAPRGANGFGYDPLFLLPDRGLTIAELPDAEKDLVSHRGRAARRLRAMLDGVTSQRRCAARLQKPRAPATIATHGSHLHLRQRRVGADEVLPLRGQVAAHRGRHRQPARRLLQAPRDAAAPGAASWSTSSRTCAAAIPGRRVEINTVHFTERPGHAHQIADAILAKEARERRGIEHLVVGCGGDGTANEICRAFVTADAVAARPDQAAAPAPGHGQRHGRRAHVRRGLRPHPRRPAHRAHGRGGRDRRGRHGLLGVQHRQRRFRRVHRRSHQPVQAHDPRAGLQGPGERRYALLRPGRAPPADGHPPLRRAARDRGEGDDAVDGRRRRERPPHLRRAHARAAGRRQRLHRRRHEHPEEDRSRRNCSTSAPTASCPRYGSTAPTAWTSTTRPASRCSSTARSSGSSRRTSPSASAW